MYLSADSDRDPGPLLERAHVLRQQLLGEHGVLPAGTEGPREAVVVFEGAPRNSGLQTLLWPRGVDLSVVVAWGVR